MSKSQGNLHKTTVAMEVNGKTVRLTKKDAAHLKKKLAAKAKAEK